MAAEQLHRAAQAEERVVVRGRARGDRLELRRRRARSAARETAPARAPRGSRPCRARGRALCSAGRSRPGGRRGRAARSRAGRGRRRSPSPSILDRSARRPGSHARSQRSPRATLDGVEDRLGDAAACSRAGRALAGGGEDRDLVGVDVEADVRARDVVDDDRVEALAGELRAAALDAPLAVLGGEADQRLPSRRRAARPASTSAVGSSSSCRRSRPGLLDLARAPARPGGSRRPPRPSAARRRPGTPRSQACCSSAAVPTSRQRDPGGAVSATLAAISVTSAPRARAACGEREAHAPRGAVAEEAHAVDRLARAAGGDEHAQPAPGSPRAARARRSLRSSRERRLAGGEQLAPARPGARRPARPWRPAARRRARRSCTPRSRSVRRFACVAGCSYMRLFIAGATTSGQRRPARSCSAGCRPARRRAWRSCSPRPARSGTRRRWRPAPGG